MSESKFSVMSEEERDEWARDHGYGSFEEYKDAWARSQGFENWYDYIVNAYSIDELDN